MAREPQIVAIGGTGDAVAARPLFRHLCALSGAATPRVLLVATATGDSDAGIVTALERFADLALLSVARFFPWPAPDLRERVLASDAVWVGGGNTANMLAIWRVHGFDRVLAEAWEQGVLLCGSSAGAICWFEAGVTDSFGPQLEGMRDGLGLLAGSACPHYHGEALRQPRYRALVENGFPAGVAVDDGAALHYLGRELREAVSWLPGATGYRVSAAGEEPLAARTLEGA